MVKLKYKDDPKYTEYLLHFGLLYEEIYKDYFRATAYVYLATLFDKTNKQYEDEYLRLCKLLEKNKGSNWLYYITLINNVDDIEVYADRLLHNVDSMNKKKIQSIKTKSSYIPPSSKIIRSAYSDNNFEEFNTESYLHSLGYKVGKSGLSRLQRRKLLEKAITSGRISKYDVIETLERNISLFHRKNSMQHAVSDWSDDLSYVKSNF